MRKIRIRDIPREQAKEEIRRLFQKSKGKILYWSDIHIKLRLDYALVQEICEELIEEEVIHEG